jgi:2-methylcitrate dehydratase PrpD
VVYTSIYGFYGAAAASAKILGLDESKTLNAFGIAFSQSAGGFQTDR